MRKSKMKHLTKNIFLLHTSIEEVRMKTIRTRNIFEAYLISWGIKLRNIIRDANWDRIYLKLAVISIVIIAISLAVIAFRPVVKDIQTFIRLQRY